MNRCRSERHAHDVRERPDDVFEALLEFIRDNRGFDFTGYKRPSLRRRIDKRMVALGIDSYADYLAHLEANQDEFVDLFDTILINVTGFFRDAPAWEYLAGEIVPRILESGPRRRRSACGRRAARRARRRTRWRCSSRRRSTSRTSARA